MLGPDELLKMVMEYAQQQEHQGQFKITKNKLWNHIVKIDPEADIRNMYEIIEELNARGWLLLNSQKEIEFDPACF